MSKVTCTVIGLLFLGLLAVTTSFFVELYQNPCLALSWDRSSGEPMWNTLEERGCYEAAGPERTYKGVLAINPFSIRFFSADDANAARSVKVSLEPVASTYLLESVIGRDAHLKKNPRLRVTFLGHLGVAPRPIRDKREPVIFVTRILEARAASE